MAWPKGEKPPREWQDWQPKEYKPTHCTQLIAIMSKGKGPQTFNAANNLGQATFYRWLRDNPDFKVAYEIAKQKCDEYLLDLLHEYKIETKPDGTAELNVQIYDRIEKATRKKPERKESAMVLYDATDSKTMMSSVLSALSQGVIDLDEASDMAELIELAQKVGETSELMAKVEALELALQSGTTSNEFKEE